MQVGRSQGSGPSGNRRMASINDMLDDITEDIFQREPFDQRTEVLVDPSLNYGLDLYNIVTGNETFDSRDPVQSDGLQFVDPVFDENDNEAEDPGENEISPEIKTFNSFFAEAVQELDNNNNNITTADSKSTPSAEAFEVERSAETHFTLRRIEEAFAKSDEKAKLLESLKGIGKEKGWYKKINNFTSKLLNDNMISGKDIPFPDYVEEVSDFCLKSMPQTMDDKIKSEVSTFVKKFSKPFDEIYKEALAEAATVTLDDISEMREFLVKTAPKPPQFLHIGGPAISFEVSVQTEPMISEAGSQTIEGLGTFDDKDFEEIVKNHDLEMDDLTNSETSEEETGGISKETSEVVITKFETDIQKQMRVREDMAKALNPKFGLILHDIYPDHRQLINKIQAVSESEIQVFEESFGAQTDKTLPPPETLTLIWKEKMYKFVTNWTWTYPTIDERLPPEDRRQRVQKHEVVYFVPPPPRRESEIKVDLSAFYALFPITKRRFGILEEYPTPPKAKKPKTRKINYPIPYHLRENRFDRYNDDTSDSEEIDVVAIDDNNDNNDNNNQRQVEVIPESDTDSDDDDESYDDILESWLSGRTRKRRRTRAPEISATSESQVLRESEAPSIIVENEEIEVEEEVEEEEEEDFDDENDAENNDFDGIESCDEEELWDDFIPERVFAEKNPFANNNWNQNNHDFF